MKRFLANRHLYWLLAGLALLTAAALLWDWVPLLRGGWGWRWPHAGIENIPWPWFLRLLSIGLVYVLLLYLVRRRAAWLHLLLAMAVAIGLPLLTISIYRPPIQELLARVITPIVTGGHYIGSTVDNLTETVQQWPQLMPELYTTSSHIAASPPGWVIVYDLLGRLLAHIPGLSDPVAYPIRAWQCHNYDLMALNNGEIASALLGVSAPIWLALTILPLFFFTRKLAGPTAARIATGAWAIIPTISIFAGTMTSFYPIVVLTLLSFLWGGFEAAPAARQTPLLIGSGLILGVLGIMNTSLFPVALWCGVLALSYWFYVGRPRGERFTVPVKEGLLVALGIALVWLPFRLWAGHTPVELLPVILDLHFDLDYPYLPWVWLHFWDLIFFMGLPIALVSALGTLTTPSARIRAWSVGAWLTILILVISGTARGETGRIWMFFVPALLVPAAATLAGQTRLNVGLMVGSQLAWFLVVVGVIRAVYAPLTPAPTYAEVRLPDPGVPLLPLDATFADTLHLDGFQAAIDPVAEQLAVYLYWQSRQQPTRTWHMSGVLVDATGQPVSATNQQPFETAYPVTCWLPDSTAREPVMTRLTFPLDKADLSQQPFWLSLTLFELDRDDNAGPLLEVTTPGGKDTQVGIGPLPTGP